MFNNDSWKDYQEAIGLKIKALEELLVAEVNFELTKDLDLTKDKWIANKYIAVERVSEQMSKEVVKSYKEIKKIAEEAIKRSVDESTKDLIKAVEMPNKALKEQTELSLRVGIDKLEQSLQSGLQGLYNAAVQDFRSTIPKVELDNRNLFDVITSYTREKSDKGYVIYQNGRKVSYKSYIEMSVRTEMQQNALYNLEASSKAAGIEFYVASSHSDSANDHADLQGYFYLADGVVWKDEWSKYNFHPKYKYLSEVKALGFLTRPNCRHYVMPVTEEQLAQGRSIHKQLGMPHRKQNPIHYENLEKQRYNERQIRKYQSRVNNDRLALKNVDDPLQQAQLKQEIRKNNSLAKKWRQAQERHTNRNHLARDRRREQPGIVVNDIGVRRKLTV